MTVGCRTCASVSGADPISPAAPIVHGTYWSVEHAWPTSMVGWLVFVLRRHAEALHDLDPDELSEFTSLLGGVTRALRSETGCLKEYVCCFAEAPGFAHVHVHVVPRADDLPPDLRGPRVFGLLGPGADQADEQEVIRFCNAMRDRVRLS